MSLNKSVQRGSGNLYYVLNKPSTGKVSKFAIASIAVSRVLLVECSTSARYLPGSGRRYHRIQPSLTTVSLGEFQASQRFVPLGGTVIHTITSYGAHVKKNILLPLSVLFLQILNIRWLMHTNVHEAVYASYIKRTCTLPGLRQSSSHSAVEPPRSRQFGTRALSIRLSTSAETSVDDLPSCVRHA